jgi:DNA-directed RNA polymerase subunit L
MEVSILKEDKNEIEVGVDSVTVAEIMRVYLDEQGADFVAWRREHPTKPAVLKIKSSGKTIKKAVGDAVSEIGKDLESVEKELKKK